MDGSLLLQTIIVIGLVVLLLVMIGNHSLTVKRVKHIERILVKQFGKEEDNDFTVLP
ncbi:MAG: hypothetical protein KAH30_03010 [Caldisericia bacterium]|nr:hypothetical protein [Caldisericia bacterium]